MYTIFITSVFNNGKDTRKEECRTKFDVERRLKYYLKDASVLSVDVVES